MEIFFVFLIVALVAVGVLVLAQGKTLDEKLNFLREKLANLLNSHQTVTPESSPPPEKPETKSETTQDPVDSPNKQDNPEESFTGKERIYSACIRIIEDNVPYYCFIPVLSGFSRKKADAAADLRSCIFYSDKRALKGSEKDVPLTKSIPIPITLYLAPIKNKEDGMSSKLLISGIGMNVSFSVKCIASSGSVFSENVTSCHLDPGSEYDIIVSDNSNVPVKEYPFSIVFCKYVEGCEYYSVAAFADFIQLSYQKGDDKS